MVDMLIKSILAALLQFFNLGGQLLHHLRVLDHIDRLLCGIGSLYEGIGLLLFFCQCKKDVSLVKDEELQKT